ncbi:MAG: SAM-dependent methyltransferase [Propionicimonas sp.]
MRKESTAATAFYVLNVLLFPVTLIGYLLWIVGGLARANESKVSMTAQGPLAARWTMHQLGVRRDVAAARVMPILPGVPRLASRLMSFPMFFAHHVTGFVPKTFRYPFVGVVPPRLEAAARVTFFDDVVERALPDIDQLVILGAGFDTRPYRLPRDTSVRSFEVDLPATQKVKRRVLDEGGVDTRGVTFLPADFEKDDWLAQLIDAGFDVQRPALFIWEGVIIYLDRAAVEDTLRKVARCANGTLIAFDYFSSLAVDSSKPYWRFARAATQGAGEPIKFGVDATSPLAARVAELLAACGLTLREQRTLGDESGSRRAWGGFTVAVVE